MEAGIRDTRPFGAHRTIAIKTSPNSSGYHVVALMKGRILVVVSNNNISGRSTHILVDTLGFNASMGRLMWLFTYTAINRRTLG